MESSRAVGLGLQKGSQIELQPDGEEEQNHAEVGDPFETVERGETEEVKQETGTEETHQWWNAQFTCDQPQGESDRNGDDDVLHVDPPRPLLRRLTDSGGGTCSSCEQNYRVSRLSATTSVVGLSGAEQSLQHLESLP